MKILKKICISFLITSLMMVMIAAPASAASPLTVSLGTASDFAVLAGSTITNTESTAISGSAGGNIGVSPGAAITGFPPGTFSGTMHSADAAAIQAQSDLTIAYNDAAGRAATIDLTGQDLGAMTLTAGVYSFSTSAQLTGTLTLDAGGDPAAVFIFKIGSTLTTAAGSIVSLINGADYKNVFWQVGSSATLGVGSTFAGNILALTSITATTTASIKGRLLARNGAVTLDTNAIVNGEPLATLYVIKHVVNNDGGTHIASDFPVGVSLGLPLHNVAGSPAAGAESPGTMYLLPAGTYYVWEDGMGYNYTATYSGDSIAGWITLAPGDVKTVTISNNDNPIIPPIPPLINVIKTAHPLALPVGPGMVTFTYTVTNPGTEALNNVTVTDDKVSPVSYVSGDVNTDGLLQTGETWIYTSTKYIDATTTNIATASGSANSMTATDTASAIVVVTPLVPPLINIVKTPNPLALPSGSGSVTYTYTVTNPGTVALSNVTVTDDKISTISYESGDINTDIMLQAGETWVYTATKYIDATTTNTATASGGANGMTATDTATATVVVTLLIPPLINVVKTPSPLALPVGPGLVTYTYRVTNPGTEALSNVTVTDDKVTPVSYVSGDINADNLLQSSEIWIYTATQYIDETTSNTVTASGRANGLTATDASSATVIVTPIVPPLINVIKTPSPLVLTAGTGSVTYAYALTNPGTVALSNVTVRDDKISVVSYVSGDVNSDGLLQHGEVWIYTGAMTLSATTTNTVTVTGSANGLTATDTAQATVVVSGGVLPNTATPWYNLFFAGAVLLIIGILLWRKKEIINKAK